MLLGVVVVFLLCNVLALIANLLEVEAADKLNIKTFSQHFFGTLIHQLTQTNNLLVTVNRCQEESVCLTIHSVLPTHPASSVNFIIYCIFGEKFRRVLLQRVASCQGFHNRTHSTLRQELHNLEVFHQRQREEEW